MHSFRPGRLVFVLGVEKFVRFFRKRLILKPWEMIEKKVKVPHTEQKKEVLEAINLQEMIMYLKCSSDERPQHAYCPTGPDSWCNYQKAAATGRLNNFKHPPAFDKETQAILEPIYEEVTEDTLLQKCLGANTQNNNESFNSCVWNIAPKHKFVGKVTLEIAALSAACIFNEGYLPILKVMDTMGIKIGSQAREYVDKMNDKRVDRAELEATEASKEYRTHARSTRILENDINEQKEGVVYEAGMDI